MEDGARKAFAPEVRRRDVSRSFIAEWMILSLSGELCNEKRIVAQENKKNGKQERIFDAYVTSGQSLKNKIYLCTKWKTAPTVFVRLAPN